MFSFSCRSAARSIRPHFPVASGFAAAPAVVRCAATKRHASTAAAPQVDHDSSHESNAPGQYRTPLSIEQKEYLDSALRVNQAGELAAVLIYVAQTPLVVGSHPHLRTLMKHMLDQETGHFNTFNHLLAKHRIRPTIMYPIWTVAGTVLGWSTAMMGREAAMACTEAVETEIGGHYNEQVTELVEWEKQLQAKGEEFGPELKDLLKTLRRIRDEELEHLDHAVENDAKEARPYELLINVIRGGCRAAIWLTEKV